MMGTDEEDSEPSWLDTDNDVLHRKEVEPLLFGTGKLSLNDPDEPSDVENPFRSPDSQRSEKQKEGDSAKPSDSNKEATKGYGSIGTPPATHDSFWTIPTEATSPVAKDSDDDSEDGGDDDIDGEERSDNPENVDDGFSKGTQPSEGNSGRPERPSKSCLVKLFSAISTYAIISHFVLIVTQVLPMFWVPLDENDWSYAALKVYLSIFAVIFMIIELDSPRTPFFRHAVFLTTFATRGFFYTFLGLICFELAYSEKAHEILTKVENFRLFDVSWFALANVVVAWLYIALGILYFLMGILCLQPVRNRSFQKDRKKWKKYQEAVKKWERE